METIEKSPGEREWDSTERMDVRVTWRIAFCTGNGKSMYLVLTVVAPVVIDPVPETLAV